MQTEKQQFTAIAPSKFAHVVYKTHKFEQMVDWYLKVFNARIQHRDDRLAFLTYDEEHHRFAFINLGPAIEEHRRREDDAGVHHVAYTLESKPRSASGVLQAPQGTGDCTSQSAHSSRSYALRCTITIRTETCSSSRSI